MTAQDDTRDAALRLAVAERLARAAGDYARRARAEGLAVSRKGPQDFVTEVDVAAERLIRDGLASAFPGEAVLGEEDGGAPGPGPLWVVDPIDGTTNFIRGLADWSVSIALVDQGRLQLGVVYDVPGDTIYTAYRGHGAHRNGARLSPDRDVSADDALITFGTFRRSTFPDAAQMYGALHEAGMEYRRHGSAALALARVASGALDAFYEPLLQSWDAFGGMLIALEAGAALEAYPVETFLRGRSPILCGAPEPISVLRKAMPEALRNGIVQYSAES